MSGRCGDLSPQQQEKLHQFKDNLQDVLDTHHDDALLLQFLRARNFDLKKSADMFRKNLEWQKKWKIDTILQDYTPPKVLEMYYGGGIVGYDKDGDPILLDPAGFRDWKGMLYSVKRSDMMRHSIWGMEKRKVLCDEQSKKLGRRVEQITMLVDLEGMGPHFLWRPGLDYTKAAASEFEQNYPETLKTVLLVNVPSIFHHIYPVAKFILKEAASEFEQNYPETLKTVLLVNVPSIFHHIYPVAKFILKEEVRQKLKVLGSNWREEILQYIDADQLPVHWGGTQTGPNGDPKCLHVIGEGHGKKVPDSYYMTNKELNSKHCVTHSISRGGCLKLQYDVHTPGTILRYEFRTKHYDLAFLIWRQKDDGSMEEILEKQRYNSYMVPEDGHITLQQPGKYFVKFDNSYSMLRGKNLSYYIELIDPIDKDDNSL